MPETILINIVSENQAKIKSDFGKEHCHPHRINVTGRFTKYLHLISYGKSVGKYTISTWSLWLLHLYTRVSNHLEMIVMIRHHKPSDTKENPIPIASMYGICICVCFTYIYLHENENPKKSTIHVGWCRFPYKYIPIKNGWCRDQILPAVGPFPPLKRQGWLNP